MSKEETNELVRINDRMGYNSDLPFSSVRNTIMSMLKSTLLRIMGNSNAINAIGSAQMNDTVTTNVTPGSLVSDGSFAYAISIYTETAKIDKIDLANFTTSGALYQSLDLSSLGITALRVGKIVGRKLYIACATTPVMLVRVDLDAFDLTNTSTLNLSLNSVYSKMAIESDGTDIYILTQASGVANSKIAKVSIETFTETLPALDLATTDWGSRLAIDDVYVYAFLTQAVKKINKSSFTVTATLVIDSDASGVLIREHLYCPDGLLLRKVDVNTFTIAVDEGYRTTCDLSNNYGNNPMIGTDGAYIIMGGDSGSAPGPTITYIDIANFTEYGTFNVPSNSNTSSFVIDGMFIYIGLSNKGVYRKYIQPSANMDSRLLSETHDVVIANTDLNAAGRNNSNNTNVTSAANAGDVTIATATTRAIIVKSIIIYANAAQTANLTSCAVSGGVSKETLFILAADATQANLNAEGKQVVWSGYVNGFVRLDIGSTIVMTLVGTGAAAVNLSVSVEYYSESDGGYLA